MAAYANKALKEQIAPALNDWCTAHGVNATLSVKNQSTLLLTVKSGKIDFSRTSDARLLYLVAISGYFSAEAYDFLCGAQKIMFSRTTAAGHNVKITIGDRKKNIPYQLV